LWGIGTVTDFHHNSVVGTLFHFVGSMFFVSRYFAEFLSHKSLYGRDGVGRVGNRLTLGGITYLTLAISIVKKSND